MTESTENGGGDADLTKKIIRQVEFYFGDYNLIRDNFMREKIKQDDGWFSMEVMLKFKRLSSLCSEPTTILEAVKKSDHGLMEVDMENQRMRRKPNRHIPEDNEEYRNGLKARTVHVNGFQEEENIDAITEFLAEYGRIDGISLQRSHDKKFKGSVFATFLLEEDAKRFIDAPMVYYKCNELKKMLRSDYYKEQEAAKKTSKKKQTEEKRTDTKDDLKGTFVVKVAGITDDTIIHMDVKRVFTTHDIHSIRFFDRTEKLGQDGYLIFQDDRTAEDVLKILDEKEGGRTVKIKSADVEFSVPNEEETKLFQQSYIEARERMFGQRGRKNRQQQHHKQQRGKKRTPKKQGKKTHFGSDDENQDGGGGNRDGGAGKETDEPPAKQAKTE